MTIYPPATESPVFDLAHMPIDPDSGPGGTVQLAREAQFPFMTGASIARVAMDASAARAKIIGLILDYQTTGRFPGWEPTPDAQLAAAELIEQYTNQQEK